MYCNCLCVRNNNKKKTVKIIKLKKKETLIYVISMGFLPVSRRLSSSRKVPSGEERRETAVFSAGLILCRTLIIFPRKLKARNVFRA